ncbi:MAG: ABC transporter ATP-binding protein [Lachnospiraceae bacterium]|jgi:multidrug/hemolysin transport system ATP-binding protein|nr:ABC transporter ATP-binding protein [Lachnospiraceae bacterium]
MDKIIEVKNLHKHYGAVKAVRGMDFYVERGKLFAFLGPNGAGKSTTIDMICTLLKPDEGEVIIDGFYLGQEDDRIRAVIGAVFQESILDDRLSVRENLMVRARFYSKDHRGIRAAIEKVIKVAELTEFIDRPYGKLSGGQRRRADIARALINTPKILFLDEPTTGLDPQTRKSVWDMIARLQKEMKMTVFLTTHYMEEAAKADYVIIVDHGQVATKGTPYELREAYSTDLIKIKPMETMRGRLIEYLGEQGLESVERERVFQIAIRSSQRAIELLMASREWIESFEVIHGTMDDVFLNIIGKEQKEND